MRKRLTTVTVVAVVLAAAAMVFATVQTARSSATPSLCHSTKLSIKAPATARSGKTVTVTGAEAQTPSHDVTATLQYKLSSATSWKNGASASLKNGAYSLKWKAPAKKGAYQLRVRVAAGGSSNLSATKKVTVK
jgi:FlaG/FlaF family flagellin (archaellin)